MGRIIEGYWDCKYCDSKGISGSIRECPNCGHPRDDTVKFYLKDEKKYVSEEKAKTINKNPDWICPYCNCLNSDNNETCVSCGSPRTKENLNYFENHEERKRKEEKKKRKKVLLKIQLLIKHHTRTKMIFLLASLLI